MALTIVTAPAVEPFTAVEAKAWAKVSTGSDDTIIDSLIVAARQYVENVTSRALINATWDLKLDSFPPSRKERWTATGVSSVGGRELRLPRPPLSSVTSVTYLDTAGDSQTWASAKYAVDSDSEPGRIVPVPTESWPSVYDGINNVTVRFISGYGAASTDIPEAILQAMRLLIVHWYENRSDVELGTIVQAMRRATDSLLAPYIIREPFL